MKNWKLYVGISVIAVAVVVVAWENQRHNDLVRQAPLVVGINPGALPDPALTPGDVRPEATTLELCDKNFRTTTVRNVSGALKEQVRRRYGMTSARDKWCNTEEKCEIDHLVPLLLGGSNDITNLFPQAYEGDWNAHHKDQLEMRMKRLVCAGKVALNDAQTMFKTNWIEGYKQYINRTPKEASRERTADAE